jgi:hypothetical protein
VEDAFERCVDADRDANSSREVGVWRGHAPVVAAAGSFFRSGEDRAEHDSVGAAGERLAKVAAGPDTAIRDDRNIASGFTIVRIAGRGAIQRGGDLRNAYAKHLARRTGGPWTDTNENAGDSIVHDLTRRAVCHGIPDNDRDWIELLN